MLKTIQGQFIMKSKASGAYVKYFITWTSGFEPETSYYENELQEPWC